MVAQVYKLCIGAAGRLSWPRDRFIVQVLDDSTDLTVKVSRSSTERRGKRPRCRENSELNLQELVMADCRAWAAEGINVKYEVRKDRVGYKAGALKEGMKHEYVERCEYVAMFDADFQPDADFLMRTIPFLVHNPRLALVQCRWTFGKHSVTLTVLVKRPQQLIDLLRGSECRRLPVDEDAGDESQLPLQGGPAGRLVLRRLLRLQR